MRWAFTRIHRDIRGELVEASMEKLVPKDHGEEIAVFRSQLIGPLVHRVLTRGQLHSALEEIASQAVRPPGRERTRHFSVPTLERWYYRFKKSGVAGLTPVPRQGPHRAAAAAHLRSAPGASECICRIDSANSNRPGPRR